MRNLLIKKHKLHKKSKYSLKQTQAFKLIETSKRGDCGGSCKSTGDGQVWYSYSLISEGCYVRDIKAGQWAGNWRLTGLSEIE